MSELILNKIKYNDKKDLIDKWKENFKNNGNINLNLIAGIPQEYKAIIIHDKKLMKNERISIYKMINNCNRRIEVFEILAKTLCYREPKINSIILVPKKDSYAIYYMATPIITGLGFVAYYYTSLYKEKYENILIVRGSNFHPSGLDSISCYINDLEPDLGTEALMSGLEPLVQLFSKVKGKFLLLGHSLGGNIVQNISAIFPSKIKKLYTFCSPGISKHMLELFENQKNPIKIKIQRSLGDIVPLFGGQHLGFNSKYAKVSLINVSIECNYIESHTYLVYYNPISLKITFEKRLNKIEEVSLNLEYLRIILGYPTYISLLIIRCLSRLLSNSRSNNNFNKIH